MNVLVIGSGGREHAIAWKLKQHPSAKKIFIAPGNAGTALVGTNIPIDVSDFDELKKLVIEREIELVVVGPEQPLVDGIVDFFKQDAVLRSVGIVGPGKAGAQLEGSKAFAKAFMQKYNIPTAACQTVTKDNLDEGIAFLQRMHAPYVLKADGLAAGKGVLIIDQLETAVEELKNMLSGKFGSASETVVIEEFLKGIELSVFVLTDGKHYKLLPAAKDYKRIGEGDTGPNTGGMGAVSPVVFADKKFMKKIEEQIVEPTLKGLQQEGVSYNGFLFLGLINVAGDPYVIEYNVRLGDPEAECVIPRIESDFGLLLQACANGRLNEAKLVFDDRPAVTVMLVSGGYPGAYTKGKIITGLESINECVVFHSGTSIDVDSQQYKTSGGRVIAVTALDFSVDAARKKAFANIEKIQFEGAYCRKDIGVDLLNYKAN